MAKHLGLAGASVVISSRKEDNVKSAVQKLKNLGVVNVIGVVCHVAKNEDRTALLSAVSFACCIGNFCFRLVRALTYKNQQEIPN